MTRPHAFPLERRDQDGYQHGLGRSPRASGSSYERARAGSNGDRVVQGGQVLRLGPGGPRSLHAVRGIDLAVAPGETVALLGPNGAGKTTTIDMILGLSRPDSGTVSVFGASPTEAVKSGWVGGTLQDGSPPDQLRVRELVTLVASYYPHPLPVDDVLRQTGTTRSQDAGPASSRGSGPASALCRRAGRRPRSAGPR